MAEAVAVIGALGLWAGMVLLFVSWGRKLADNRGRSRTTGGWLGGMLGFVGVGIVALMGNNPDEQRARAIARLSERPVLRYWVMGLIGGGFALLIVGAAIEDPSGTAPTSTTAATRTATARAAGTPSPSRTATPIRTAVPTATVDQVAVLASFVSDSFMEGCLASGGTQRPCECAWDYIAPRITADEWTTLMGGGYPSHLDDLAYEAAFECYVVGYR